MPFGIWANRHSRLKAFASDALEGIAERGIVNPQFTGSLMDQHLPAAAHYYGTMVWVLMMLEHWLRAHAPSYRLR